MICTGACAAAGLRLGAGGFFAAASAGAAVGRAAGAGATAAPAGGLAAEADPGPGSGVMILTGGVEAELGNSALVGLPVGADGGSAAIKPAPAGGGAGAFHDDA